MLSFADLYIMRNVAREKLDRDDDHVSHVESEDVKAARLARIADWEFTIKNTEAEMEARARAYARFHRDAQARLRMKVG